MPDHSGPDQSPEAGDFSGKAGPSPRPGSHSADSSGTLELPYPEELQTMLAGRFVVESFIGQGGMGAVYKGLQLPLKRPVAIKILARREGADEFDFEGRFKREAYAMASMTHPHIVQVYDCGDAGENFLFISMEFVEGGDLSRALKRGPLPEPKVLRLFGQICEGVQAAHERGLVHRDIKPANIFLSADGRAKVADFGLVKRFDSTSTFVTRTGLGMGTPDYAAPEQFEGSSDIDHRADIYSLGVMLYQMLTGRLPRGMAEPPSALVPGLDVRFDAIVVRAMKVDRQVRYQHVHELRHDLAAIGTAVSAPSSTRSTPPAPRQQAQRSSAPGASFPASHAAPASAPAPRKFPVVSLVLGALVLLAITAWIFLKYGNASSKTNTVTSSATSSSNTSPVASSNPDNSSASPPPVTEPPKPPPVVAAVPAKSEAPAPPAPVKSQIAAPVVPAVTPTNTPVIATPSPSATGPSAPTHPADAQAAALESEYRARLKVADEAFAKEVSVLAANLKGAIERNLPSVRGTPTEAMLRQDLDRIEKKEPIPPPDEPKTPALLVTLRKVWHTELGKRTDARAKNRGAARQAYAQSLATLQKELEGKGDGLRAGRLQQARTALAKEAESLLGSDARVAGGGRALNPMPAGGGKVRVFGCLHTTANEPLSEEPFAAFSDFVQVVATPLVVAALRSNGSVIVQSADDGSVIQTFTHTTPPVSRLSNATGRAVWALTEDGHVILLPPHGTGKTGPWQEMDGLVQFSGGELRQFMAGLKADGRVVLAATVPVEWMPKAETLPKAKAVQCDNSAFLMLTEEGAVMGWHKSGAEVKVPPPLQKGIERWHSPLLYAPTDGTELALYGTYIDKDGRLYKRSNSTIVMVAENVEDFTNYGWRPKNGSWRFSIEGFFGEVPKATEVLSKSSPISWSLSTTRGIAVPPWNTGVFVWIE